MDEQEHIASLKAELETAYARLGSMRSAIDTSEALQEVERLERALLGRYQAYVEKRDSTIPPKAVS